MQFLATFLAVFIGSCLFGPAMFGPCENEKSFRILLVTIVLFSFCCAWARVA